MDFLSKKVEPGASATKFALALVVEAEVKARVFNLQSVIVGSFPWQPLLEEIQTSVGFTIYFLPSEDFITSQSRYNLCRGKQTF